jgi:hypothetical protein
MPTHIRAMCQWQVGSALPKDVMQITPCFRADAVFPGDDPTWTDLADDLADGLNTWADTLKRQLTVKLYDIAGTKPNRPKATAVRDVGHIDESPFPRELALCLSFYGGPNAPKNRGRLYVPLQFFSSTNPGPRPTPTHRTKVGDLAAIFAGLGGIGVDWIVWSPTVDAATAVENWFVDDEWDVQRRRGLRPTTRTTGTTSEA